MPLTCPLTLCNNTGRNTDIMEQRTPLSRRKQARRWRPGREFLAEVFH